MTQQQDRNNKHKKLRVGRLFASLLLILSQVSYVRLSVVPGGTVVGGTAVSSARAIASTTSGQAQSLSLPGQRDSSPEALEILKARGFIAELYSIRSRDNTPLSVYHIINPFANQRTLNKYPVLVFHGVAADAAQMVAHSERTQARPPVPGQVVAEPGDTSLALMLANNNFDVFLVDARGTNLNNHLVSQDIDPEESQKYWNFSLDEQIHYDLPAVIDFVLAQTHSDKVHYIGFSESTFFMFAFLTRFPEYQHKLASFVALAPVAYVGHIRGLALSLFSLSALVPETINANFMPQPVSDTIGVGVRRVCNNPMLAKTICALFASGVAGLGDDEQSRDFYSTLMKSTSIKAVKHFFQLFQQKRFGMYDYGPVVNLRQYGTIRPPDYDLAKIKLPNIVLFRGATDFLSNSIDQQILLAQLGTRPYRDFNYPTYNHIDFLTGRTIVADINLPATKVMFELLQMNVAQSGAGSIFRDSNRADLPKLYTPLVVVRPDGSRAIKFSSHLVNNLVDGVIQTKEVRGINQQIANVFGGGGGMIAVPTETKAILKNQWDILQNIDDKVQNLGTDVDLPEFKLPQLPNLMG